jgi:hypothetical protein
VLGALALASSSRIVLRWTSVYAGNSLLGAPLCPVQPRDERAGERGAVRCAPPDKASRGHTVCARGENLFPSSSRLMDF